MIKNITKPSEYACSGCGACVSVCPKNAIQLTLDDAGFFTACLDKKLCVDCGMCQKVCTRYDDKLDGISLYDVPLYAVQSADEKTVKDCSSGGLAHELTMQALDKGYKVIGAVYDTKTDIVYHKIITSKDEVCLLDSSKYLQSNTEQAFKSAVAEARKNPESRFAVFGTPCQIAGLAKVCDSVGVRERFLLTEIFCHGVPSYKLWDKECGYLRKKLNTDKFDSVLFRYKKNDWHSYCLKVDANGKTYYGARETELFYQVFFENILLCDSCQKCRMRQASSMADLRIGDYWGRRFQHRSDGVSATFACTDFGRMVMENLFARKNLIKFEPSNASEMFAAQNMAGYHQNDLHDGAMKVLRNSGDIMTAIKYYRARQPMNQKFKRLLLKLSTIIPSNTRAKLRKANSSRVLKK